MSDLEATEASEPVRDDAAELERFREFRRTGSRRVRNAIVESHMGLAAHVARRYQRRGVADDDLRQVAMLGLVKAVDRFDPDHGAQFSAFAGRTIEGELKRYFRDKTWTVRVPRGAKELHLLVRAGTDELSKRLGRSPSVDELAEHLAVGRDDVLRGIAASAAYSVGSIDAAGGDEAAQDHSALLATTDDGFDGSDDKVMLAVALAALPERERRIVELRFFDDLSQSEIADRMGMSQMHVSRLLRRSFEQMRDVVGGDAPDD